MTKLLERIAVAAITCIIIWFCLISINRAANAPVVLKDRSGQVCGCVVDGDVPTLDQCNTVDTDELHEVIIISKC
jgi:hypothetical protein